MREAEVNKLKLTPQFLELKFIQAIANNSKIFFGNKVGLIPLFPNLPYLPYLEQTATVRQENPSPFMLMSFACRYQIWYLTKDFSGTFFKM